MLRDASKGHILSICLDASTRIRSAPPPRTLELVVERWSLLILRVRGRM